MALNNSHIATLVGAGADAMSNMFEVGFIPPLGVTVSEESLKIRTKAFSPPAPKQATYDVHWKTVSVPKVATKIELDRTLEFEIRLDAYYNVYMSLLQWQSYTMQSSDGFASNNPAALGTIKVKALGTPITDITSEGAKDFLSETGALVWKFEDVAIINISLSQYDTETANPVMATVTFIYGNYTGPYGF